MIVPAHLVMDLAISDSTEDYVMISYRDSIIDKIKCYARAGETSMCFETTILTEYQLERFKSMFEAHGYTVVKDNKTLTFSWPEAIFP